MTSINKLTQKSKPADSDLVVIWDADSNRTRSVTYESIKDNLADLSAGTHVESGTYSAGTLTLKLTDNTEVVITGWTDLTGIMFSDDNAEVGNFKAVNFKGDGVQVSHSDGELQVEIDRAAIAPTLALQFSGIYGTLQDLTDAVAKPSDHQQAIVLKPSEKYYHGVGNAWVELAPVGSFHPNYLGAYDTVDDLKAAEPSPADDSLAIVGTAAKSFYIYTSSKWDQVTHTDLPSLDARVSDAEGKITSNINRIQTAEGHLQTLQTNDQKHDSDISAIGDDIRQLQGQVYTGNDIQDDQGNSLSDITGLKFVGAEVSDDDGDKTATVTVSPKITVANGQQPGSTSATGNALIFEGATITPDPNDSNVVKVNAAHGGINIGDGVTASREVTSLIFDGFLAYGAGNDAHIHLHFKHFKTITERDAWSTKYTSAINYDVVALVDADSNGFVAWYKWTAATSKWSGYDAQGVVMSDSNGAIPKNIKTVVFGPGFEIQQAGDQEDAALVTYTETGSGGIDGITIDSKKVTSFETGPSLEFADLQGKDTILIKPGSFEPMTAPSFLGKSNEIKVLDSGLDIRVFCNDPITPYGMYFSPNNALEGINVQEDDDRDPNLGGQLTELLGSVGFDQKAPKDGTIKLWFMYHQNGAYLPDGYVSDMQNKPLIIERAFKAGDTMKVILSGAYYAQGVEAITMHVEHSFTGESIALNPDQCLFCVNQFDEGTGTSLDRIEFLRRMGVQITSEVFKFDERFAQLSSAMAGINQPEAEVNPGSGEEYLSQFGINNLTKIKAEIQSGTLSISDNGTDIADFYLDYLVDNTRTSMMRGKQFTMKVDVANQNSGMRMALMSWTGNKDVPSKVYDMRDGGGEISPETGWTKVSDAFIAENPSGDLKVYELDVTIPNNSVNLAFIIYPSEAQSPMSLTVHEFAIKPKVNFTGYAEIDNYNLHEIHLTDSDEYLELGQNVQGYASLRYTLGYKPLAGYPMPMGEVIKGKAPLTLDKTRNVVAGSAARGGEGVLVAGEDGQVSISFDFLLWNEQDTDTVVDFWLVLYQQGQSDGQETKIAGSEMQFTVPKNSTTHGIPKIQPSFLFEIEKGQAFGLRGSANKADGAYIESTKMTDYMVKPIIDFKVITADSSDSTDLINAPIPKANVVDRRVYSFTGNAQQNITIDVEIPADVELAEIEVVKHSGTVTTSVKDCEYAYDSSTKKLTVHVGNAVTDGKIYLTLWSGVA